MRRMFVLILSFVFLFGIANLMFGEEKRIYNDGVIDYAPMSASFTLSAEDTDSTLKDIRYSIDGSPLKVYEEPISFAEEGRHIIVYRATDLTDNVSCEKIYSVVTDATPPDGLVSVDGPAFIRDEKPYITTKSKIVLWATDNLSGVDTIYVNLDDGDYMAYTEPVIIAEEGLHTTSAYAIDNVGNRSDTYIVKGYVDSTPPSLKINTKDNLFVVNNKNYTNSKNEFSVEAYDDIAGVKAIFVSLDGSEWVSYTDAFNVQIAGFHTLKASALDLLGNESDTAELSFFVDVVPPKASMETSIEE